MYWKENNKLKVETLKAHPLVELILNKYVCSEYDKFKRTHKKSVNSC